MVKAHPLHHIQDSLMYMLCMLAMLPASSVWLLSPQCDIPSFSHSQFLSLFHSLSFSHFHVFLDSFCWSLSEYNSLARREAIWCVCPPVYLDRRTITIPCATGMDQNNWVVLGKSTGWWGVCWCAGSCWVALPWYQLGYIWLCPFKPCTVEHTHTVPNWTSDKLTSMLWIYWRTLSQCLRERRGDEGRDFNETALDEEIDIWWREVVEMEEGMTERWNQGDGEREGMDWRWRWWRGMVGEKERIMKYAVKAIFIRGKTGTWLMDLERRQTHTHAPSHTHTRMHLETECR